MEEIKTRPGQTIRALREQRGLTRQRLAELAEVSMSYLQSLEQDERPSWPNVHISQRIARSLGVDVSAIWPPDVPAGGRSAS